MLKESRHGLQWKLQLGILAAGKRTFTPGVRPVGEFSTGWQGVVLPWQGIGSGPDMLWSCPAALLHLQASGLFPLSPALTQHRPGLHPGSLGLQVWDQGGWPKKDKGLEETGYDFKEQHTGACILAVKHLIVHSLVGVPQAGELEQVLINTTRLGTT